MRAAIEGNIAAGGLVVTDSLIDGVTIAKILIGRDLGDDTVFRKINTPVGW